MKDLATKSSKPFCKQAFQDLPDCVASTDGDKNAQTFISLFRGIVSLNIICGSEESVPGSVSISALMIGSLALVGVGALAFKMCRSRGE